MRYIHLLNSQLREAHEKELLRSAAEHEKQVQEKHNLLQDVARLKKQVETLDKARKAVARTDSQRFDDLVAGSRTFEVRFGWLLGWCKKSFNLTLFSICIT